MWAKYINEDYIIEAPDSYAGISNFNQKPEMMVQFDFMEVKDDEGFDESLPIKYKKMTNYIKRYNIEPALEQTQEEKTNALIDMYLNSFQGGRKGTNVTNKSEDGSFIPLDKEDEFLTAYKLYLKDLRKDRNFPYVEVKSLGEWLKDYQG